MCEIFSKTEELPKTLIEVFGSRSGPVVQRAFLRTLYSHLRLTFVPYSGFKEALNYANERFEVSVFRA
jgi:hypothetical protein